MDLEPNVGDLDRLLRLIFGIYGMLMGFLFIRGVVGIILGIVSLILLITGFTRFCGIYKLLGISTIRKDREDA